MEWLFLFLNFAIYGAIFLFDALLALAFAAGTLKVAVNPVVGARIAAATLLIEIFFIQAPQIPLGLQISTTDITCILLVMSILVRFIVRKLPLSNRHYWIWILLGLAFAFSGGRGLLAFGSAAGTDLRPNFHFWAMGLYFASFTYTSDELVRLWRVFQHMAMGVIAIAMFRWIGNMLGIVSDRVFLVAGASTEFRAVGSSGALVLAVCTVCFLYDYARNHKPWSGVLSVLTLSMVIVLQHRSVWLSLLFMLIVLISFEWKKFQQHFFTIVVAIFIGIGGLAMAMSLGHLSELTEALTNSVAAATQTNRGTHIDRIEGWIALLDDWTRYSVLDIFTGRPYGAGYSRVVLGHLVDYSPHNFYVQLLLRIGLVGIALFLLFQFVLMISFFDKKASTEVREARFVLSAVMTGLLVYYISYQADFIAGAIYGGLMAMLIGQKLMRRHGAHAETPGNQVSVDRFYAKS